MDIDVTDILQDLRAQAIQLSPSLEPFFDDFLTLYEQRLWHQLTMRVEQFASLPEAQPLMPFLYSHFIKGKWDLRMNVLALTKLAIKASQQLLTREKQTFSKSLDEIAWLSREQEKVQDEDEQRDKENVSLTLSSTGSEALDILLEIKGRLEASSSTSSATAALSQSLVSAQVLLLTELAKHHLLDPSQPLSKIILLLNQAKSLLHSSTLSQGSSTTTTTAATTVTMVPSDIRAQLYQLMAVVDKATGAYDPFYEHAMLFLASQASGHHDPSTPLFDPSVLADDLILAILASPTHFCVGEVMLQPLVINRGTPALITLLQAVSDGNLSALSGVQLPSSSSTSALLSKKHDLIMQKCTLMALITLASNNATLTFEQIRAACALESIMQVPSLVVQAISKGLLKSTLSWSTVNNSDNGMVQVQWTHPRVIGNVQGLMDSVQEWRQKVTKAVELLSVKRVGQEEEEMGTIV